MLVVVLSKKNGHDEKQIRKNLLQYLMNIYIYELKAVYSLNTIRFKYCKTKQTTQKQTKQFRLSIIIIIVLDT